VRRVQKLEINEEVMEWLKERKKTYVSQKR
jgi:hypothetical protein